MHQKIFLIVLGSILLILGILLLIAASQHDWEDKEYKKIAGKNAPTNLKNTSNLLNDGIKDFNLFKVKEILETVINPDENIVNKCILIEDINFIFEKTYQFSPAQFFNIKNNNIN